MTWVNPFANKQNQKTSFCNWMEKILKKQLKKKQNKYKKESKYYFRIILIFKFYIIYCNTHERHLCFDHLILNIMLMKKLLLYILIGGILLIGTYGCANYEEDLLDEISPKQMLATVTTEIELADAVYHRDTVLDPAAE